MEDPVFTTSTVMNTPQLHRRKLTISSFFSIVSYISIFCNISKSLNQFLANRTGFFSDIWFVTSHDLSTELEIITGFYTGKQRHLDLNRLMKEHFGADENQDNNNGRNKTKKDEEVIKENVKGRNRTISRRSKSDEDSK
ncbi:MAG: hypothetical protein IIA45_11125 [Bacteroidetes bacterium]|nr:hypothetical protein [Bacteroidota bacterium]